MFKEVKDGTLESSLETQNNEKLLIACPIPPKQKTGSMGTKVRGAKYKLKPSCSLKIVFDDVADMSQLQEELATFGSIKSMETGGFTEKYQTCT